MFSLVDNSRPCSAKKKNKAENCPPAPVSVTEDANSAKDRFTGQLKLAATALRSLPKDVELGIFLSTGSACHGGNNYRQLEKATPEKLGGWTEKEDASGNTVINLVDQVLNPEGESWKYTHMLVFTQNKYGKSKWCEKIAFVDNQPKEEL